MLSWVILNYFLRNKILNGDLIKIQFFCFVSLKDEKTRFVVSFLNQIISIFFFLIRSLILYDWRINFMCEAKLKIKILEEMFFFIVLSPEKNQKISHFLVDPSKSVIHIMQRYNRFPFSPPHTTYFIDFWVF